MEENIAVNGSLLTKTPIGYDLCGQVSQYHCCILVSVFTECCEAMTGAWQPISVLVLAASARAQIARPDTRRSLAVPPHPDPSLGTVEETYGGRANVTWPDGSGYSVMMSLMR